MRFAEPAKVKRAALAKGSAFPVQFFSFAWQASGMFCSGAAECMSKKCLYVSVPSKSCAAVCSAAAIVWCAGFLY
jgi:hypothetical protein